MTGFIWNAKALASKFATPGAVANLKSKTIMLPNGKTIPRPKTLSQVPKIRNLPADQALFIARQQPHIIPRADGGYSGAPRTIRSTRQLNNQRGKMDAEIDAGAAGGDWYDRYRNAILSVTNNSSDADWMSAIQGMFSAGVSPQAETAFALKSVNSGIATKGGPDMTKAARPAQLASSQTAIEANDWRYHQLGAKTGEYAAKINPRAAGNTSVTGVNDFRHAETLGHFAPDGTRRRSALTEAEHVWADLETALSVDRANLRLLDGRSTWTGEQVQAAPWVKQKGDDLFRDGRERWMNDARAALKSDGATDVTEEYVERIARQFAFQEATKTIGDFFGKHTAFATYEAQPFAGMGHLPLLETASKEVRDKFAKMTQSSWANSPGGRDDIYSNAYLTGPSGQTGYVMRTQSTNPMQGVYTHPLSGNTEYNLGEVARPLVAFDTSRAAPKVSEVAKNNGIRDDVRRTVKTIPDHDRALLDGGEAIRAFIDAQGAGAYHKPWWAGDPAFSNSIYARSQTPGQVTPENYGILSEIGRRRGFGDVVHSTSGDAGDGLTFTNFGDDGLGMVDEMNYGAVDANFLKKYGFNQEGGDKISPAELNDMQGELAAMGFPQVDRAKVDSGYLSMFEQDQGYGSGAVTENLLGIMDSLPRGVYDTYNANGTIPFNALARAERDRNLASTMGGVRSDIQNARRLIGEGPGWIDRLREALKAGTIPLPIAAFALTEGLPQETDAFDE